VSGRESSIVRYQDGRIGRPREWDETAPGEWRFRDDVTLWLAREGTDADSLWLATRDGIWPFDPRLGRLSRSSTPKELLPGIPVRRVRSYASGPWQWMEEGSNQWAPVPAPSSKAEPAVPTGGNEVEIRHHPAVTLLYRDGKVDLVPRDRKPAFIDGKLFFDATVDCCLHQGSLTASRIMPS
jgi:hypothetical protein